MSATRRSHTATLLTNGKVLVAGGENAAFLASAEIYDPITNTWSAAANLPAVRSQHTATLLTNGKVLVAGGWTTANAYLNTAVTYDPTANTWTATGNNLTTARRNHTATLLGNGKVLVTAGEGTGPATLTSAEIYDSGTNNWSAAASLTGGRGLHTATLLTNGKVLVAGGLNGATFLATGELYDATLNTWSAAGSLAGARDMHSAALLPNGKVLVAGGLNGATTLTTCELYDSTANTWSAASALAAARNSHTTTVLPTGKLLVAGGISGASTYLSSAEVYDSTAPAWTNVASMATGRVNHTATLLSNGKLLIAGGFNNPTYLASSEVYDSVANTWTTTTGSMATARSLHTSTLLLNGKVLVAGGTNSVTPYLNSAEIFDPATNTWSAAANMNAARREFTATLLPDGKVLVAGGVSTGGITLNSSEVYNPATNTWANVGNMAVLRSFHTATLLQNGKVLVTGGFNGGTYIANADIFDPATSTWTAALSMASARTYHSATLLPNGKVLVTGGYIGVILASTEIYDSVANTWSSVGSLTQKRSNHSATILSNGKVLICGGLVGGSINDPETYDPQTSTWTTVASMSTTRRDFTLTLLPNRKAIAVGGLGAAFLASAETFDSGLGFLPAWQPVISTINSPVSLGGPLILTGTGFKGVSEASSGGAGSSPTNYPLVQLQYLNNGQTLFLPPDPANPFSSTSFRSLALTGYAMGFAQVTVYVNGIPSNSALMQLTNSAPTITGVVASQAVNDNATLSPFSGVTIGDVDTPAQPLTISVTLDTAAKGVFTPTSLTASGFTNGGAGIYNFSGTAAAATTAIRQLVFAPTANRVAAGLTETTTLTISANDTYAAVVTNNTTTVVSTSVNEAPTIAGAVAGQAVNDTATLSPFTGVTLADNDVPVQTQTVSVTLDLAAKGTFTAASLTASGFTSAGGGVYNFSGTAAAATTAIRLLVYQPTPNRVALGLTETTTMTISIFDGFAAAVTNNTTTVVSTSVNDAPTIAGTVAGQAVTDKTTVLPFTGVTIADADTPAQSQIVRVTLDTAAKGTFTAASLTASTFSSLGGGVYSFTGTAAAATTAIRQLVFQPTADRVTPGTTETTTLTITANDSVAAVVSNSTTTCVATSVNDAPSAIGGAVAGQAVTDKTTVSPFTGVTIGDVDNQSLTVRVTLDTAAKGTFTAASLTASGFTSLGGGVYNFNGLAAASQTAIRLLVYAPTANRVAPGLTETTTLTITVNDGIAAIVSNGTTTVVSTSVNDAPTITGSVAGQAVNDTATLLPFSGVTVTDGDVPAQTLTVSVTLDLAAKGTFTAASLTASGFTSAGGGVYTFSGNATATTTAIRLLVYQPTPNRVAIGLTETTTMTISVNDGVAAAVTNNTTTVVSTSVNDAPTIVGAVAAQAVTDKTTVLPFTGVTVADADTPAQSQIVRVTLDTAAKGSFTAASLTASTFTSLGGGVYSFTGTAAAATTAIRQLVFQPTSNRVTPGTTETTTLTITANDSVAAVVSNSTTTCVATSVNDAPSAIGGAVAGQAVTDKTTVSPFTGVTIGDVDNQSLTVRVTLDTAAKGTFTAASLTASGFTSLGGGVYNFNGLAAASQTAIRLLVYAPTANRVAPGLTETTTLTITVNDGIAAIVSNGTTTVVSTSVNDAPTITGSVAGQAVNDTATLLPFSGVTVTDGDVPAQTLTVSVTLDSAAKGTFTAASLTASGFTSAGGGVYNFSGNAAAATTAIRLLVYQPTSNRVAMGLTETTTMTISVNDGVAAAVTNNTTTVISTSVDDPPTISGTVAGQAVTDKTTLLPFAGVTIADADAPAQTQVVRVTLDTAAKGTFTTASLTASGFISVGGGVYSFSGTAAAATTAIRLLVFAPAANHVAPGTTETTTLTITANDNIAPVVSNNITTCVASSINDVPNMNPQTFSAFENSAVGAVVGTVLSSDVDFGQTFTYAITAGNTGNAFAIDPTTGQITVATPSVLVIATNPTFSLTVQVSDSFSPPASVSSNITVNLTATDSAPVFQSGPGYTPNNVSIGQVVTFTAQASNTATYAWDFGDGSNASGATTTHTYTTAGSYTVKLVATSPGNNTTIRTLNLTVSGATDPNGDFDGDGIPNALDEDTDNDGFPNNIELAAGSDPFSATDRPFGAGAAAPTPFPLTIVKMGIGLSFKGGGNDGLSLSGTLSIPDGFVPAGKEIILDVGGAVNRFTLDAKGASPKANAVFKVSVKAKKSVVLAQVSKFGAKFGKDTFASKFADEGLTDETVKSKPVNVSVLLFFNGAMYQKTQSMLYSAKAGSTGKAK